MVRVSSASCFAFSSKLSASERESLKTREARTSASRVTRSA
ncbi:hypothetical protein ACFPRL_07985 [Pseudoclavibacter helvolus]